VHAAFARRAGPDGVWRQGEAHLDRLVRHVHVHFTDNPGLRVPEDLLVESDIFHAAILADGRSFSSGKLGRSQSKIPPQTQKRLIAASVNVSAETDSGDFVFERKKIQDKSKKQTFGFVFINGQYLWRFRVCPGIFH
jgi:hypothetical protein